MSRLDWLCICFPLPEYLSLVLYLQTPLPYCFSEQFPQKEGVQSKLLMNEMEEYFGSGWESSFIIARNLNYRNNLYPFITVRNPFVPYLTGKIKPDKNGAKIIVRATFPPSILFVSVLFYFVLLIPQIKFIVDVINGKGFDWRLFSYIILPLGLYFVQMKSFTTEIKIFKLFLKRVVKAVPMQM